MIEYMVLLRVCTVRRDSVVCLVEDVDGFLQGLICLPRLQLGAGEHTGGDAIFQYERYKVEW